MSETTAPATVEEQVARARKTAYAEGRSEGYRHGYGDARDEFEDETPWEAIMERWHNEHHAGVMRFCYEEPCRALRGDSHS